MVLAFVGSSKSLAFSGLLRNDPSSGCCYLHAPCLPRLDVVNQKEFVEDGKLRGWFLMITSLPNRPINLGKN